MEITKLFIRVYKNNLKISGGESFVIPAKAGI